MKFFFARWCGHATEIRDLKALVQDQADVDAVIDLLINAKRVAGLSHSGPALARHRIDQAIALLREGK